MLDLYVMSGGKKLRCGYTTGSCATAATKAATIMLFNDVILENVEITTPKGIKIIIPINSVEKGKDYCIVSVIKDGGDDPDITNGIEIYAKVEKQESGFTLTGGEGIGIVTKDGLFIEKGLHAINPTPRKTIEEAVKDNLPQRNSENWEFAKGNGIKVTISTPQGREIAQKTFNPRLGIVGGISILISNFVGFALECCSEVNIKEVILIGHIGKVSKIAYGCFNTHSRVNDVRLEVIALELALLGYDTELVRSVLTQKTSEGAVKFLGNGYEELYKNIGNKIVERMKIYTYGKMKCDAIMYYGFSDYSILYNSLDINKS